MDNFLDRFGKKNAETYGLEKEGWNVNLAKALRGTANEVCQSIPPGHEHDFDFLKLALLKLTASVYENKFCTVIRA